MLPFYLDGHLDLAYNVVVHGRDLTRDLLAVRRDEGRTAQELLVTLPELRRAGVGLVVGTLFTFPLAMERPPGAPPLTKRQRALCYETPDEAHALAVRQLDVYRRWEDAGRVRLVRSRADLEAHVTAWTEAGDRTPGLVLAMEGADPIRTPDELGWWTARGLRMVGPAWQRTRYAGGTGAPGPLTPLGRDLVAAMQGEGVILDVSHLAEQSFWDAMDLAPERVCASHSNARALVPGDRHLSDAMLDALAARDAVVGLALGNALLVPADVHPADAEEADDGAEDADTAEAQDANAEDAKGTEAQAPRGWPNPRATLADARRHAAHLAGRLGWHRVGIGSDFDGGFGVQETPPALTRGADFARLARLAPPHARDDLLGGAWLRFFRRTLPA